MQFKREKELIEVLGTSDDHHDSNGFRVNGTAAIVEVPGTSIQYLYVKSTVYLPANTLLVCKGLSTKANLLLNRLVNPDTTYL